VRACASPRWRAPGRRARAGVCSPAEPPVACAQWQSPLLSFATTA